MTTSETTSLARPPGAAIRPARRLSRRLFGLSPEEATFARRGFHAGDLAAQQRLEHIGKTFLAGYHLALEVDVLDTLAMRLNASDAEFRGFAFEGAAMALALLDILTPWSRRRRWQAFAGGPATDHIYMVHVGLGWALARLGRRVERPLAQLDPLLGWLAIDGYGFHEGYFHPQRYVMERALPARLTGYALRVFDQGLGRSLWFVEGADPARLPATIAAFPAARHGDLWSGLGLACAYAGGVDPAGIATLCDAAGPYRTHMAQGAAFAAKARQRAQNPAAHTDAACRLLCGMPADAAAQLCDQGLQDLAAPDRASAYELWRQRIREACGKEVV